MDSTNNREEKNNRPHGQEWDDAAFGWDNMKDGIFENILAEDPQFFEEKRKKRMPIWFWFSAGLLLLGGLGFWFMHTNEEPTSPKLPAAVPVEELPAKDQPIATATEPDKIFVEKNNQPTEANNASPINPSIRPNQINDPSTLGSTQSAAFGKTTQVEAVISNGVPTAFSKIEEEKLASIEPVYETQNLHSDTPSLLALKLEALKVDPSTPSLVLPVLVEKNDGSEEGNNEEKKGKWRFAATGGSIFSFAKYAGTSAAAALRNDNTSPYFGYEYGLTAAKPLANNNSLLFGLNRQVAYQNIDIYTERQIWTLQKNVLLSVTHYAVGGRTSEIYGDTIVQDTQKTWLVQYNEFKSVQAEFGFAKNISLKKWSISPLAGIAVGLVTHQDGRTVAADKSVFEFNADNAIVNQFQFKTWAGLEVGRQLTERVSLLLRYRFDKQWNNASAEKDLVLRPSNHEVSLGVAMIW
ncbi:MAG: hypothetical protein R2825_12250 [Saprospiraceae bacterium]